MVENDTFNYHNLFKIAYKRIDIFESDANKKKLVGWGQIIKHSRRTDAQSELVIT